MIYTVTAGRRGDGRPEPVELVARARTGCVFRYPVRRCPRADADHRRRRRQYAHVGHRAGVICVAGAFTRLPWRHRAGLLAHELGHLALGDRAHSERDADRAARQLFGLRVGYRDTRWGRRLQTLEQEAA